MVLLSSSSSRSAFSRFTSRLPASSRQLLVRQFSGASNCSQDYVETPSSSHERSFSPKANETCLSLLDMLTGHSSSGRNDRVRRIESIPSFLQPTCRSQVGVNWNILLIPPRPSLYWQPSSNCMPVQQVALYCRGSDVGGFGFAGNGISKKDGKNVQNPGTAARGMWIHELLPSRLKPFAFLARLDKPIGTWLLAWPCMWSISLAAPAGSLPDIMMLSLFGLGAILLRGAGCTMNDLLDKDIDKKVERTKSRPLASGDVTTFQAISFLSFQLLLGLGILLQLNNFSRVLGASSLLLVGSYPLMKRWTFWPQAFLGLTFNWGALLGWAAVRGSLDLSVVIPLYMSGICWTLVYDTIYAHQDKEDDAKVGVKSTALLFADNSQLWLAGFGASCITALSVAGYNADVGWPFYVGMLAASGHLFWQISTVNFQERSDCNSKFVSNKWFGAIVFAGITSGKILPY
eukprot:c23792_g1_i1 orf=226-1605(+)